MFQSASVFNKSLDNWVLSPQLTNLNYMFWEATRFNQPLVNWVTTNIKSLIGTSKHIFHKPYRSNIPII